MEYSEHIDQKVVVRGPLDDMKTKLVMIRKKMDRNS